MKDFKQDIKDVYTKTVNMFHKAGFWFFFIILIGIFIGGSLMSWYQKSQMNDAILLGGLVYNKSVYDLKERIR